MPDAPKEVLYSDPRMDFGRVPTQNGGASTDIRNEPEGDRLEAEFRKFETEGPNAVDWKFFNETGLAAIHTKSKDLRLAARLTYGLFREEGYGGLAVGLAILDGMVDEHWEDLFPPVKRERGRAAALDWLAERVGSLVEAKQPDAASNGAVVYANDTLLRLDAALQQKMTSHPVALGPLVRALRPHVQAAQPRSEEPRGRETAAGTTESRAPASTTAEAPPSNPAAQTQAEPTQARQNAAPRISEVSMDQGADEALRVLGSSALKVAASIRQSDLSDFRSYSCSRFALWTQIAELPSNSAGKTAIAPPRSEVRTEIDLARSAGDGRVILSASETAFASAPFWLDVHHHAAVSAAGLGEEFATVHATIVLHLRNFLTRLPGLEELTFNDGMPFAGEETKKWIAEIAGESGGAGAAVSSAAIDDVVCEAEKLGQAGDALAGLKVLSAHLSQCSGEREQFLVRLRLAAYCLRFDMLETLFPLLAEMRAAADARNLDRWEPVLATELALVSWRAIDHKKVDQILDQQQLRDHRSEIVSTLIRLDIVKVAELGLA